MFAKQIEISLGQSKGLPLPLPCLNSFLTQCLCQMAYLKMAHCALQITLKFSVHFSKKKMKTCHAFATSIKMNFIEGVCAS